MSAIDKATALLQSPGMEGCSLTTYIDPVGIPTIGWGTTRMDGKPIPLGMHITQTKADQLLHNSLLALEAELKQLIRIPLTENELAALLSFVYNIGLEQFKDSTMLSLLNQHNMGGASLQFKRWVYGTVRGKRVKLAGLITRREKERRLFLS